MSRKEEDMQQDVSSLYRQNHIRTADQGRLILMMYNHAIFSLRQAEEKIEAKDFYQKDQLIIKAQDIILELLSSLNFKAGKIAYSLERLYNYMVRRLIMASQNCDRKVLQEVIKLLNELKEAWETVVHRPNEIPGVRGLNRTKAEMDRERERVAVR
jgi:flagellar protein FliS